MSLQRCAWLLGLAGAGSLISFRATASDEVVTRPVHPDAPWARALDDELSRSELEQLYGVSEDELPTAEPVFQDGMLFDENSLGRSILEQRGLPPPPLPALDYDPAPGILYVEMGGVTLSTTCGNGDSAHSAKNCTPLVNGETAIPAWGSGSQQSSLVQTLRNYYDPFNLVVTTTRPPDWIPYTMAVIGGSSSLANCGGEPCGGGVCGIANVQCDGLRRNHVSLTFPQSCGGVAEVAAQETAHNWGLEHTDNQQDLLYPYNTGGFKTFVDSCMTISHATSQNPVTQCTYVHELYCPNGGGEQQNTYAELMGVFGPRAEDTVAPAIIELFPADGTTITTADKVTISAAVDENTNFLAAKWTWLEGLPEDLESFTRCTNKVCNEHYNVGVGFNPNEVAWDFLSLNQPPAGTYKFKFEVADSYGGYHSRTLTVTVEEPEGSGDSGDDSGSGDSSSDTDDSGSGGTESDSGVSSDDGTGGASDSGSASEGGSVSDTDTSGELIDDDPDGCACRSGGGATPTWTLALFGLLGLAFRPRR